MRRIVRLVIALSVVALAVTAAIATPASYAAQRMWVGFHDDPSFRWSSERQALVARSAQTNATIIRLLVQWNVVAKLRPASGASKAVSVTKPRQQQRGVRHPAPEL